METEKHCLDLVMYHFDLSHILVIGPCPEVFDQIMGMSSNRCTQIQALGPSPCLPVQELL